jgi:N-acetyltransferase
VSGITRADTSDMQPYVNELRRTVDLATPALLAISDEASAERPAPGKWSAREIVGHLIDSASHNHQRFVRARFQEDLVFAGYEQDAWVAAQDCQHAAWAGLVGLWSHFNRHIAHVMAATPEAVRLREHRRHNLDEIAWAPVPRDQPATLDDLMRDYVGHLKHHLRQLLGADWDAAPAAFDLQPTLRGELVELRPLRPDDYDALYAVASDPLIWEQHPARNRYEAAVFRRYFDEGLASGGAFFVTDVATGNAIGSSRYFGYDPQKREVEIGWTFLARSHWGGRYNGEMKRLMLEHALRFVDRVVFLVGPANIRSQRAVERIGGIRAGTMHRFGHDNFIYEITAASQRLSER